MSNNSFVAPQHERSHIPWVFLPDKQRFRMYNVPEQYLAAHRALLDTAQNINLRALEGAAKLFELNVEATRATVNRTAEQVRSALDNGPTVQPINVNPAELVQPVLERAAAYSKRAYGIVTSTNEDIVSLLQRHVAGAQQTAVQVQQAAVGAVQAAAERAPAAVEAAGAAATNTIDTAQAAFEQVTATATKAEGRGASKKSAAASAE